VVDTRNCNVAVRPSSLYTQSNKNPSTSYFVRPAQAVTCVTVAIIIRVVLLCPYLCIRGVSLSSIDYNQSHRVCINRRQKYNFLNLKIKHYLNYSIIMGTAVAQWLRCCDTIRKVAGSIPAGVSEFFIDIKSFR